ncbi:cation transport protein-domain-containing protein [Russula earlei]|uniref:Cation transport protein-domain-containing protein n=1 Tax=Russula earlei TaxID=71964 RepID=A0ACC0U8H2_9AGAM|nr:cation transport protein-domain-containing protein [Russula earlei]
MAPWPLRQSTQHIWRRQPILCPYRHQGTDRLSRSAKNGMPADEEPSDETSFQRVYSFFYSNLNFYRLHILYFTFTPLLFSGIFYATNGRFHITYVDALFNSVSAMAVCGLASVDLSSLTGWQQAILFIQMCLGNPVLISWIVVYVRRNMFAIHCENIVRAATCNAVADAEEVEQVTLTRRILSLFRVGSNQFTFPGSPHGSNPSNGSNMEGHRRTLRGLRPDMIRRVDDALKLVNPSGRISEGQASATDIRPINRSDDGEQPLSRGSQNPLSQRSGSPVSIQSVSSGESRVGQSPERHSEDHHSSVSRGKFGPASSDAYQRMRCSSLGTAPSGPHRAKVMHSFPSARTRTIEFASDSRPRYRTSGDKSHRCPPTFDAETTLQVPTGDVATEHDTQFTSNQAPTRLGRIERVRASRNTAQGGTHTNFGGFPGPREVISQLVQRFFPAVHRQLRRTITTPRTTTITPMRGNTERARAVPYISFDAVVGFNSSFESLNEEQLEELGGVEFRALNALLWIVGAYHICVQLLGFTIIAPYMSLTKWKNDFHPPRQQRSIIPAWFSLFQVVSAYTNAGISLVDQSMTPFQRAYPMIFAMIFLILAGNTAFPIFLRFSVWVTTKLVPKKSRLNETLHFLLDHPRRCFIYLFPSHQTWFLLTLLVVMNTMDWIFFLILDIGNKTVESIPVGVRVIDGMLQATAVRAAGFSIVSLAALAPGVKVLYVIMMYISVYPIAMSVRSTNVYEERSLGIYDDKASINEESLSLSGNRVTIWGNYLAFHARKQLAFDMWWLGLALFLICIIERDQLENIGNATWFNIFNIVFELVSAYGGVGLSLGVPYADHSFSGAFRPLSKLIVCLVMLRGRHRGLPVAIDRAVLLPFEYRQFLENDNPSSSTEMTRRRSGAHVVP